MFSVPEESSCALPAYLLMPLLVGVNGDEQPLCHNSTSYFIPSVNPQCMLFYLDRRINERGGRKIQGVNERAICVVRDVLLINLCFLPWQPISMILQWEQCAVGWITPRTRRDCTS